MFNFSKTPPLPDPEPSGCDNNGGTAGNCTERDLELALEKAGFRDTEEALPNMVENLDWVRDPANDCSILDLSRLFQAMARHHGGGDGQPRQQAKEQQPRQQQQQQQQQQHQQQRQHERDGGDATITGTATNNDESRPTTGRILSAIFASERDESLARAVLLGGMPGQAGDDEPETIAAGLDDNTVEFDVDGLTVVAVVGVAHVTGVVEHIKAQRRRAAGRPLN